ncbi:hypothetical protein VQ574_20795 (plasmid) [Stutzerimonas frequens]|uniref:hypothetical protein n=1 Tax=Stutzerimonas frequens TaxID=2968969 RepID=UPI002DBD8C2A|nr:hypothetical protein [Stutzerimonas frequens]WRW29378.1 hypothetical protein VQ574_20795 [Stutzerimonas frequens]
MKSDSTENRNVVYPNFGKAAPRGAEMPQAAQAATATSRKSILDLLRTTFKSIVRSAAEPGFIETSEGEGYYDLKRPSYGAYNSFIGYYPDGRPNFFLRHEIDRIKQQRPFTRNAIELRCDALGLAIYVSGLTQIDLKQNTVGEGVRVVVYDHVNLKPSAVPVVKTPEELVDKLHHILVTTYNQLAREYNLAGYTAEFLTLTSSHPALPSIRIDMERTGAADE